MTLKDTITDLIANFAILTIPLFFTILFLKSHRVDSLGKKMIVGLFSGLLGTILMIFTVHINDSIIDFRQLSIMISAFFGGFLASIITGVMIFVMRLILFQPITEASFIAATNIIVVAVLVGIVATKFRQFWVFWTASILVASVSTSTTFYIIFGSEGIPTGIIFSSTMISGGFPLAYIIKFLIQSRDNIEKLKDEAANDFLTGLNNNRTFDSTYSALRERAKEKNEGLSVAVIDIDHFKKVNDTYGHLAGDEVLVQLASIMNATIRSYDSAYRNGGEEFSLLMYDTSIRDAIHIAEKIRIAVAKHKFKLSDGRTLNITVSIGVASFPGTELDRLILEADKALYQAKAQGRNQVCAIG